MAVFSCEPPFLFEDVGQIKDRLSLTFGTESAQIAKSLSQGITVVNKKKNVMLIMDKGKKWKTVLSAGKQ